MAAEDGIKAPPAIQDKLRKLGLTRRDDLVLDIRYDADLARLNADVGAVLGDPADVLVLGAAREDLVADHQDRRRDRLVARRLALRRHRSLVLV